LNDFLKLFCKIFFFTKDSKEILLQRVSWKIKKNFTKFVSCYC